MDHEFDGMQGDLMVGKMLSKAYIMNNTEKNKASPWVDCLIQIYGVLISRCCTVAFGGACPWIN